MLASVLVQNPALVAPEVDLLPPRLPLHQPRCRPHLHNHLVHAHAAAAAVVPGAVISVSSASSSVPACRPERATHPAPLQLIGHRLDEVPVPAPQAVGAMVGDLADAGEQEQGSAEGVGEKQREVAMVQLELVPAPVAPRSRMPKPPTVVRAMAVDHLAQSAQHVGRPNVELPWLQS